MSRTRNSERTQQQILDVAMRLFATKGYEKTSLNDILAELNGLTKGAIYHHFKSKEDILIHVIESISSTHNEELYELLNHSDLNAKEKLEMLYDKSLQTTDQETLFSISPNLLDNPTFLTYYIKIIYQKLIPKYFIPLVREGVADGSIQTDYPDELGELILLLTDFWMNPLIFKMDSQTMAHKALLFNQLLQPFGLHILSEQSIQTLKSFPDFASTCSDSNK